jgi:putative transposase
MRNGHRIEPTPAAEPPQPVGRKPRARKRPKDAPTHVRCWPLRPNPAQGRDIRTRFVTGTRVYNAVLGVFLKRSRAEQQAELAEIEALIAAGRVLSTRIVRMVIDGRDTYRMQLVCDGHPSRRHLVGDGRVSFDLGPSEIAVAVQRSDGSWAGWVEPLADVIRLDTARLRRTQRHLDRQHRTGSPGCFHTDGTHHPGRCDGQRSRAAVHTKTRVAELHRRLAEHRKTLHGGLANRLFAHGADIACEKLDYGAWQKTFPRSVRDRAPGLLVQMIRRKAESAGSDRLYEYNPESKALSQTCLCGDRRKKPLSQRVHRCGCGIGEHRDLFSAYLGLHVRPQADGPDRLDLEAANHSWLHRQDVDGLPRPSRTASLNRRGRRHPPTRRSVARIKARRAARRQSRSARISTTNRPTAALT